MVLVLLEPEALGDRPWLGFGVPLMGSHSEL